MSIYSTWNEVKEKSKSLKELWRFSLAMCLHHYHHLCANSGPLLWFYRCCVRWFLVLSRFKTLPKNWLTRTAPPVACWAACRLLVTPGLTSEGVSSGVMWSRILAAPLWMARPVASAPFTNPSLNRVAPKNRNKKDACTIFSLQNWILFRRACCISKHRPLVVLYTAFVQHCVLLVSSDFFYKHTCQDSLCHLLTPSRKKWFFLLPGCYRQSFFRGTKRDFHTQVDDLWPCPLWTLSPNTSRHMLNSHYERTHHIMHLKCAYTQTGWVK